MSSFLSFDHLRLFCAFIEHADFLSECFIFPRLVWLLFQLFVKGVIQLDSWIHKERVFLSDVVLEGPPTLRLKNLDFKILTATLLLILGVTLKVAPTDKDPRFLLI
jgi:hypothetical protein